MVAPQLVLGPVLVGVLAGLRLDSLGTPAAAGLGYAAYAVAQIAATLWLLAASRPA